MNVNEPNSYNFDFLDRLENGQKIGIDKDGRMYAVQPGKLLASAKAFFSRQGADASKVLVEYAQRKVDTIDATDLRGGQSKYLELQKKILSTGMVDTKQSLGVASSWYRGKIEKLVAGGMPRAMATAIVTTDICNDPNLSEEVKKKVSPEPTKGGTSGSYFIKNLDGKKIGIFKPRDEEIYMPNNPRGYANPLTNKRLGPRAGHELGISWQKEIGAWTIDQGTFVHVPRTSSITLPFPEKPGSQTIIPKEGSFQEFAKGEPTEGLTGSEIERIPVEEVQKLAIFDLAVGNADRNLGNMLYDKASQQLTPIDHGLSFLDGLDWMGEEGVRISETNCHWSVWPQVKSPMTTEAKEWVLGYDIDAKCQQLADTGMPAGCIREHKLRMIFLKIGVEKGFTIEQMGALCMQTGQDAEKPTLLDKVTRTTQYALGEGDRFQDEALFYETFRASMSQKLEAMRS